MEEPKQTFETTIIFDPTTSLHFYVVPARAFKNGIVPNIDDIISTINTSEMKLDTVTNVRTAQLAAALSVLMNAAKSPESDPRSIETLLQDFNRFVRDMPKTQIYEFAEYAAYARVIPIEYSPLTKEALASFFTRIKEGAKKGAVKAKDDAVEDAFTHGVATLALGAAGLLGVNSVPVLIVVGVAGVVFGHVAKGSVEAALRPWLF